MRHMSLNTFTLFDSSNVCVVVGSAWRRCTRTKICYSCWPRTNLLTQTNQRWGFVTFSTLLMFSDFTLLNISVCCCFRIVLKRSRSMPGCSDWSFALSLALPIWSCLTRKSSCFQGEESRKFNVLTSDKRWWLGEETECVFKRLLCVLQV